MQMLFSIILVLVLLGFHLGGTAFLLGLHVVLHCQDRILQLRQGLRYVNNGATICMWLKDLPGPFLRGWPRTC
jgi:hypothetical protein